MCIPKHYMRPMPSPQQLAPLYPADMAGWGEVYQGAPPGCAARGGGGGASGGTAGMAGWEQHTPGLPCQS